MLKVLIHLQRNKLISIFPAVKILSNNLNSKIMRVTKVEFKNGVIKYVTDYLTNEFQKPKLVERIKGVSNINDAYQMANRYARIYIHKMDEMKRMEFIKESNRLAEIWVKNGNKWLDESSIIDMNSTSNTLSNIIESEIVDESNEDFIKAIEESDKLIEDKVNNKVVNPIVETEKKSMLLLFKLLIENQVLQLSKVFVDKLGIESKLIGYKDGIALYYSDGFNVVYELI